MPLPPSSTRGRTLASVGFLPFTILSFLNSPLRPGPIFFSSLSGLWQTAHCSKTAFPLAASPLSALDLPLKVLIWSDDGQTKVSYYSPAALARRHHLDDDLAHNLAGIDALTDALVAT